MSVHRRADPDLQGDVDNMILDYLVFAATEALLEHLRGSLDQLQKLDLDSKTNHRIAIADGFISIYESLHVSNISSAILFRLRLFQFVKAIRRWHSLVSDTFGANVITSGSPFGRGKAGHLTGRETLAQTDLKRQYRASKGSLLRTLPSFMALSASQLALQGGDAQITEIWMHLAGEYMLHAALEDAIVFNTEQTEVISKAFLWEFDWNITAEEGSDDFIINAMFFDNEAEATNETWMQIRNQYETKLKPPSSTTFQDNVRAQFSKTLSLPRFEERLLVFLENLHSGLSTPVLSRLELAQVDILDPAQANEFREMICAIANMNNP